MEARWLSGFSDALETQCRTQVELEWTYSLVSHEDRMNEREEMEHWQGVEAPKRRKLPNLTLADRILLFHVSSAPFCSDYKNLKGRDKLLVF